MWYVYVLRSIKHPWTYVGHTGNLNARLQSHNDGLNISTKAYAPFEIETYIAVKTKEKAIELEKYFKTGSGKAILKKRFLN